MDAFAWCVAAAWVNLLVFALGYLAGERWGNKP